MECLLGAQPAARQSLSGGSCGARAQNIAPLLDNGTRVHESTPVAAIADSAMHEAPPVAAADSAMHEAPPGHTELEAEQLTSVNTSARAAASSGEEAGACGERALPYQVAGVRGSTPSHKGDKGDLPSVPPPSLRRGSDPLLAVCRVCCIRARV